MSTAANAPEPTVRVKLLATIEPTSTDRQRYEAGSIWHMPLPRVEALEAAGAVEILDFVDDAPAPAPMTPDSDSDEE